jgi:hypothetical protein
MCDKPELISMGDANVLVVEIRQALQQPRIEMQLWLIQKNDRVARRRIA